MKRFNLISQLILCLFILVLSSCKDDKYDLDDDNLDKTGVFSPGGVNVPIGDMEQISIIEELRKNYDGEVIVDQAGNVCVEYLGSIPVEFPDYTLSGIDAFEETTGIGLVSGNITIPSNQTISLVAEEVSTYKINDPKVSDRPDWIINAKEVGFNLFKIQVSMRLSGITYTNAGEAQLKLKLQLSDHFTLADKTIVENKIELLANLSEVRPGEIYTFSKIIEVESYSYSNDDTNFIYGVDLLTNNTPLQVNNTNSELSVFLNANDGTWTAKYLKASIEGKELVDGSIAGFEELHNSFGDGILSFRDPSFLLTLNTNVGSDFGLNFDLSRGSNKAYLETPLLFTKPSVLGVSKETNYLLAPENSTLPDAVPFVNMRELIATIPDRIDYNIEMHFKDENATLLPLEQTELSVNYLVKLPFDFENLDLTITDSADDIFGEDIYEDVLQYAEKSIAIEADDVTISVHGAIKLSVDANILDANRRVLISKLNVLDLDAKPNLSIKVEGDEIELMRDAKHLEFKFTLTGNGAIKEEDHIKIEGLKLVSDGGIKFDF